MKLIDILTETSIRDKAVEYDKIMEKQKEEEDKINNYYLRYGREAEKKDKRAREGKTSFGKAALGGIAGTAATAGMAYGASKIHDAMPQSDAYRAGRIGATVGTIGTGIAAGATAAHYIRKGLDVAKKRKERKIEQKMNESYEESLQLSISNIPLTEGMSDVYFLMRVLDENGFAVTDNNIAVLAEAIDNGHVDFV